MKKQNEESSSLRYSDFCFCYGKADINYRLGNLLGTPITLFGNNNRFGWCANFNKSSKRFGN